MHKPKKNKRLVSSEEIQRLYTFTKQHYVEYYDLQTELVDHLATGIEENWEENPTLSFEHNLHKEFKKFGVFGFMEAIESHRKTINKHYLKILKRETIAALIDIKTLLGFILVFTVSYVLSLHKIGLEALKIILFIFAVAGIIFIFRQNKKQERMKKKNEKIYLLDAMLSQSQSNAILFILPFQLILNMDYAINFGSIKALFISFIISFSFLLFYVMVRVLPGKKEAILKEIHPERKYF